MAARYYLKQNVLVEPLFNQWYAWSHLIAPASAAMNIANQHIKIMKSYISAPQVHANAVKSPALLAGQSRYKQAQLITLQSTDQRAKVRGEKGSFRNGHEKSETGARG
jgi:hypothetical protein